jgi:hypothetical protein
MFHTFSLPLQRTGIFNKRRRASNRRPRKIRGPVAAGANRGAFAGPRSWARPIGCIWAGHHVVLATHVFEIWMGDLGSDLYLFAIEKLLWTFDTVWVVSRSQGPRPCYASLNKITYCAYILRYQVLLFGMDIPIRFLCDRFLSICVSIRVGIGSNWGGFGGRIWER